MVVPALALDPVRRGCPELLVEAGAATVPIIDPPPPGPGTPLEPLPTSDVRFFGRRLEVMLCEPITHRPLGQLRTALVDSWGDGFGPQVARITASKADVGWDLATINRTQARRRRIGVPDGKGLEVAIGDEGALVFSGILSQPFDIGDGRVAITVDSPDRVLDERTLGETEQHDFYEGRGRFSGSDPFAGWSHDPGVEIAWNTDDPWEGTRSLKARGFGWVYGPWVSMTGQEGYVRHPVGSAILRVESGRRADVATWVRTTSGALIRPDFSRERSNATDQSELDWQGPVVSQGWLPPVATPYLVRVGIDVPAGNEWVEIDFVRLQWPTLTGFRTPKPLSEYPAKLMTDLQFGDGGSNEGIGPVTVLSHTEATAKINWSHTGDHEAAECLAEVTDAPGGPDVWCTPAWRMLVAARRGEDRNDLSLGPAQIIRCKITPDPGGEVDEFRAVSDLGSDTSRVVHGYDTPRRTNRRRIREVTRLPVGMTFDRGEAWTRGQGEWAARLPVSAVATVSYEEGERWNVGDGARFAWAGDENDRLGWWGPVRIVSREFHPGQGRNGLCDLTIAPDPVVGL